MRAWLVSPILSVSCFMMAAVSLPGCQKKSEYQPPAAAIPDIPPGRGSGPTENNPAFGVPAHDDASKGRVVVPP